MKPFDVTSYDALKIVFDTIPENNFKVDLRTLIEGYSNQYEFSFRYCLMEYNSHSNNILIPLDTFKTAEWWFYEHKLTPEQYGERPDLRLGKSLTIQSSSFHKRNTPYTFRIKDIAFVRSKRPAVVALILWIISLVAVILLKRKGNRPKEPSPRSVHYTPLNVENSRDESFTAMVNFIGENFSDVGLSIEQVAREVGLSQRKAASLFKETTGESFKRNLNSVRLEEAKRLLLSTDRGITEIAYMVGFNYPSHFNKLFHERFSQTPSEMRKQQ